MLKNVKKLVNLATKRMNRNGSEGIAVLKRYSSSYYNNGYYSSGYGRIKLPAVEKYRVECYKTNTGIEYKLYHYETLTCQIVNNDLIGIYGESRSDIDSIDTFYKYITDKFLELHYYPSKDVFMCNGQKIEEFTKF